MITAEDIARDFTRSLAASSPVAAPFRHWVLRSPFGPEVARQLTELPFAAPEVGDTAGRRETHNSTRIFFGKSEQAAHAICRAMAEGFQSNATVEAIGQATGVRLGGTSLRIEYCLDREGFWLEPHTDIGAKRFTMLIYLSDGPGTEEWGTDLYDGEGRLHTRVPSLFDTGVIFIPGADTWHGFAKRAIQGIRRSIIVNYVGPEWRARHELAFPDSPVAKAPLPQAGEGLRGPSWPLR